MRNIYRSLLLLIVGATQKELARQIHYLKIENRILRSKLPPRVSLTPQERNRLVRFASRLGKALNELVTIVHPNTVRRWMRETRKGCVNSVVKGRRRTPEDIRQLVLKLARENGWGYTRILGELKKLRIHSVSRNTVKNILRAHGLDPGPTRGAGTWDEFLKLHAATLWQCDFFSKKVLTPKGFRDLFVLVFLHVGSRRVFLTASTYHPNNTWVQEQAAAFLKQAQQAGLGTELLLHDRDCKFTASFDAVMKAAGLRVQRASYRSPNTVAFVERFIQTIKQECLDYFVVFGEQHMNFLCSQFVEHYHLERPHQGKQNQLLDSERKVNKQPPADARIPATVLLKEIRCHKRLGGLLKHYYRAAA